MGRSSDIKPFFQRTVIILFSTAVATVGRFGELLTNHRFKIRTECIAHGAAFTSLVFSVGMTDRADTMFVTSKAVGAGIIVEMETSGSLKRQMIAHFFGNGGRVFVQIL